MPSSRAVIDAYLNRINAVWRNSGSKSAIARYGPRDDIGRFWKKVYTGSAGDCWPWIASIDASGYGIFKIAQVNVRAHRFSYLISNGDILPGQQVCHRCDNPKCVNPAHIFLGTMADNQRDKMQKGRQHRPCSTLKAKIDEDMARRIMLEHNPKPGPRPNYGEVKRISEKLQVTRRIVDGVIHGRTWKHLRLNRREGT